jgi:hypothetical protein
MVGGADLFWKTLAFLSFHIVQLVNMVREAIAFWFEESLQDIKDHHSSIEESFDHSWMRMQGDRAIP